MKIKNFSDYINQTKVEEKLVHDKDEQNVLKPTSHEEKHIYTYVHTEKNFCIETKNQTAAITLVEYYAKQRGMEAIELFAGKDIKGKEDLNGIPTSGGKIAIPKWASTIKDNPNKKYIVLLVGDFDKDVQNALMTAVEGQVGGYDISANSTFVLICENAESLEKPLKARLSRKPVVL